MTDEDENAKGTSQGSAPVPTGKAAQSLAVPGTLSEGSLAVISQMEAVLLGHLGKFGQQQEAYKAELDKRLAEKRQLLEDLESVDERTASLWGEGRDSTGQVTIRVSGGDGAPSVSISDELAASGNAQAIERAIGEALGRAHDNLQRAVLHEWAEFGKRADPDSPLGEAGRQAAARLEALDAAPIPDEAVGALNLQLDPQEAIGHSSLEARPGRAFG